MTYSAGSRRNITFGLWTRCWRHTDSIMSLRQVRGPKPRAWRRASRLVSGIGVNPGRYSTGGWHYRWPGIASIVSGVLGGGSNRHRNPGGSDRQYRLSLTPWLEDYSLQKYFF